MWQCPVCDTKNPQMQCKKCGFDGSCDYERYPSLVKLRKSTDAVSRIKSARQTADANMLRCPSCGGSQFSVDVESLMYRCSGCGHQFSPPKAEPKQEKTERKPTLKPEKKEDKPSFAERVKSAPRWVPLRPPAQGSRGGKKTARNLKTGKRQPKIKENKERSKGVTLMLLLGWACILYQAIYFSNTGDKTFILMDDPVMEAFRYALIGLTILTQLRLGMKKFEPFGSKLGMGFDVVLYCIRPFVLLCLVPILLLSANIPSLLLLVITSAYHLIFHFGWKWFVLDPMTHKKDEVK